MIYTCIGDWESPGYIRKYIKELICYLEDDFVPVSFWVGNHSALEREFLSVLREIKREYPALHYCLVLTSQDEAALLPGEECFYPEQEAESTGDPIEIRNQWFLDHADMIIHHLSPRDKATAKLLHLAEEQNKELFPLAEFCVR